jgi:hypothetical protein
MTTSAPMKLSSGALTPFDAGDDLIDGDSNSIHAFTSSAEVLLGCIYWPARVWVETNTGGTWTTYGNEFSINDISDLTDMAPAGWSIGLRLIAMVRTTAGGTNEVFRLYNVTDSVDVTNTTMSTGGMRANTEMLVSGLIPLGSSSGDIDDNERIQPQYKSKSGKPTGVSGFCLWAVAVAPA